MPRTILVSIPVLLLACRADNTLKTFNSEPSAEITSHSDGDVVLEGYIETFRGAVSDPDDEAADLTATWLLDGEILCESAAPDAEGISTCEAVIPAEASEITLEAQDPDNAAGSDQVALSVVPTESPEAEITAPAADGIYYSDQLITFEGILSDSEDDATDLVGSWESSLDGTLDVEASPNDDGEIAGASYLTEGEHFITLTATDTTSKTGSANVTVDVGPPNSAPSCGITAPEDGAAGEEEATVVFEASVADADVPADWLAVSWESDKDGELGDSTPDSTGAVAFPYSDLSVETHVITLTVTDEVGATCSDFILYSVGTPPEIHIESPTSGDVVEEGELVSFQATVSDGEDAPTDLALSWVSDLDGEFSTQGADSTGAVLFNDSSLSTGTHSITATVTDTDSLYASAILTLQVNGAPTAPTVALGPDPAQTSDDLVVSITSVSTDPDGDSISYSYAWSVDGVASSASTSATLSSTETAKGQIWSVEVTPGDGYTEGPAGSDELEIGNTAPEITRVVVDPDPASTSDELSCAWSFTDEDGDDDESTLEWTIDGATLGTDATLSGVFISGDEVVCTVTAYDGTDWGSSESDSVTITNTAPEITAVTLSPSPVYTHDTLTASVSTDDAEGDSVTVTYDWYVDGTRVSETGSSLDGATGFDKDQEVYVVVTPDDGTEEGSALSSDSIIVSNSPPTAPEISITEVESDCMSIDFDGSDDIVELGPLGLSSQWTAEGWVNWDPTQPGTLFWNECFAVGSNYSTGTFYLMHDDQCDGDQAYYEDRTLDSSLLADGSWHHLAVTYDGSFEVFIDGVSVGSATPSSDWHYSGPYAGGLGGQTGHSTSYADASVYAFRISDSVRYTSDFAPNDVLEADSDTEVMWVFEDDGALTIDDLSGNGNDGSVVDASWVEDCPSGGTGSGLICVIDVDASDDDGDAISYTIEWDMDGTAFTDAFTVYETGDGVSSDDLSAGESWTCTVTPNDGDEDGDSASTSLETAEPTYYWANTGSDSVEMVYGSCGTSSSTSATCDSSTMGELIYINPSGASNLERKTLGETHLGVTGGRGFSISISSDGTEATWVGATSCGGDYLQTDTVDIYECVSE